MIPIFKDRQYQDALEKDGYVLLPLLGSEEIETLKKLFDEIRPQDIQGIYSNVHGNTRENNERVDEEITKIFAPYASKLFINYEVGGGTFLVKGANKESASTLHQDWNSVDEEDCVSISMWCPLIDVDEENGCLQVIPGSHNWFNSIRSISIPTLYVDFTEEVQPYLQSVPLKAGHVCIYAHNLFHGSKPNHSGIVRVAAVTGILPKGKKHLHYYRGADEENGEIDVYGIDMNFYYEGLMDLQDGSRPQGFPIIDRITNPNPEISMNEFQEALFQNGVVRNQKSGKGFLSLFRSLFAN